MSFGWRTVPAGKARAFFELCSGGILPPPRGERGVVAANTCQILISYRIISAALGIPGIQNGLVCLQLAAAANARFLSCSPAASRRASRKGGTMYRSPPSWSVSAPPGQAQRWLKTNSGSFHMRRIVAKNARRFAPDANTATPVSRTRDNPLVSALIDRGRVHRSSRLPAIEQIDLLRWQQSTAMPDEGSQGQRASRESALITPRRTVCRSGRCLREGCRPSRAWCCAGR